MMKPALQNGKSLDTRLYEWPRLAGKWWPDYKIPRCVRGVIRRRSEDTDNPETEPGFPMRVRYSLTGRWHVTASRSARLGAAIALAVLLAACGTTTTTTPTSKSSPIKQGGGIYKVGNPYQIAGVWYYPYEDEKYDATGIASWYGPQFHGKKTANGEIFDQNAMTAAHPTLPMPVLARVTNLENGKSVIVRINDRGPFAAGREIDMSKHAAEQLGFMTKGTAKVRVQYIGRAPLEGGLGDGRGVAETFVAPPVKMAADERQVEGRAPIGKVSTVTATGLPAPVAPSTLPSANNTQATTAQQPATMRPIPDNASAAQTYNPETVQQVPVAGPGNIYVQAGAFQNLQNAESVRQQLAALGRAEIHQTTVDGTPFYRVRLGPLSDVPAADTSLRNVIAQGHKGARIVVD